MNISWSQVDLKDGLIVLAPSDTKNKTGRALPIHSDMLKAQDSSNKSLYSASHFRSHRALQFCVTMCADAPSI